MSDRRVYGGGGGGGGSNLTLLLQNQRPSSSSEPVDTFFLSGSSPSFLGSSSMMSFEDVHGRKRSNGLFFCPMEQEENGDEDFDEYLNHPGKKRRLTSDQVRFLERSFEVENKLEPERKVQLAKDLNLQPRQVAIWFQNRRARWKSKQLEKDYDALQARFNSLKANYDSLLKEKDNLRAEVHLLTDKLRFTEKEIGNPQFSDATGVSQAPPPDPIAQSVSDVEESKVSILAFSQEELNSAKSDVFESESPHYTDGAHSSSYVFEHDYHSDLSQDEEDNLSRSLLPPVYIFPKLEDADFPEPPGNSCNLGGFPVEDQAIWSWCF